MTRPKENTREFFEANVPPKLVRLARADKSKQGAVDREKPYVQTEDTSTEERIERRVSFILNGSPVETVVSERGYFQFAVQRGNSVEVVDYLKEGNTRIDPPYHLRDLWETGLIKFPSGVADCGSTAQLLEEIQAFVRRLANLPADWVEVVAIYVLMTWVYDRFTAVPYLRFLGEPGTGKTRLLQVCAAIAYKAAIASGNITGPALFRTIDLMRGTVAVDEADFKNSEEWSDIIKVLNNGYATGTPVVRCERSGADFTPQAFYVYGPKIISTRLRFADEALESRCITLQMREEPLPEHIPLQLPLSFEREALELRNKLLRWRLDNFHRIHACQDDLRRLSPRLGQIGASLVAVAPDEKSRRKVVDFLTRYDAASKMDSPRAVVLQAIVQLRANGGASATVGDIAQTASALLDGLGLDGVTAKRVGGILRSMGLSPRRTAGGYVVDLPANELRE